MEVNRCAIEFLALSTGLAQNLPKAVAVAVAVKDHVNVNEWAEKASSRCKRSTSTTGSDSRYQIVVSE